MTSKNGRTFRVILARFIPERQKPLPSDYLSSKNLPNLRKSAESKVTTATFSSSECGVNVSIDRFEGRRRTFVENRLWCKACIFVEIVGCHAGSETQHFVFAELIDDVETW